MPPRKANKVPSAKKASKKAVKKAVAEPSLATEPSLVEGEEWTDRWPKKVVEKHKQRQDEHQQRVAMRVEQKQQRLINNGVPSEKRPI